MAQESMEYGLNTKGYLKANLDDLKVAPEEVEFVKAIEQFLNGNQIHYWYYYNKKEIKIFMKYPMKLRQKCYGSKTFPCN